MTKNIKAQSITLISLGVSLVGVSIVFILAVNTVIGLALLGAGLGNLIVGISKRRNTESDDQDPNKSDD